MKRIRPHHLYCMPLYVGGGYSPGFCANMEQVIASVLEEDRLFLTQGADDICSACPHHTPENLCGLGEEDILKRDGGALPQIAREQDYAWSQLLPLVLEAGEEGFHQVCADCCWRKQGYCSINGLKQTKMLVI